jgi:hypothetical protein
MQVLHFQEFDLPSFKPKCLFSNTTTSLSKYPEYRQSFKAHVTHDTFVHNITMKILKYLTIFDKFLAKDIY